MGFTAAGFGTLNALDTANLVLSLVGLAGYFGYAHARRIVGRGLWRGWAVLQPLWDASYTLIAGPLGWTNFEEGAGANEVAYWIGIAMGALIQLPIYLALFRYGYRSQALWKRAKR